MQNNKENIIFALACLGHSISLLVCCNLSDSFNIVNLVIHFFFLILICITSYIMIRYLFEKALILLFDKTEKKANDLLNERLNHETINHNAIMQNIVPSNASLSRDIQEILTRIDVESEKNTLREERYLQSITMIKKQMENLQLENCQLKEKTIIGTMTKTER